MSTKRKSPPKPTPKQKAFIKEKLANPTISNYQAAIRAGYSPKTAKNAQDNIVEKREVKRFVDLLAPDREVAETINNGLGAFKRDHFSGEIYPDFGERRQTARLISELKGHLGQSHNLTQINVGGDVGLSFTQVKPEEEHQP